MAPRAACDEAGWVWTGAPQGQSAVKKMGHALPASHSPTHVGCWSGAPEGRPDTRWCGGPPHRCGEADPEFVQHPTSRAGEITFDTVDPIQGGAEGEERDRREALGRSRGGYGTKILWAGG